MQLVRVLAVGESAAQRYRGHESRKWLIFITICFKRAKELVRKPVFLRCFAFVHCTRSVGSAARIKGTLNFHANRCFPPRREK
jgi:hypothetical protein